MHRLDQGLYTSGMCGCRYYVCDFTLLTHELFVHKYYNVHNIISVYSVKTNFAIP